MSLATDLDTLIADAVTAQDLAGVRPQCDEESRAAPGEVSPVAFPGRARATAVGPVRPGSA